MKIISIGNLIAQIFILFMGLTLLQASMQPVGLFRQKLGAAAAGATAKAIINPAYWVADRKVYKKHPWLVKGAGIISAGLVLRQAYQCCQKKRCVQKKSRETCLITAVMGNDLARVRTLCTGVLNNFDAQNLDLALCFSVDDGYVEIVRTLIKAGANVNATYKGGLRPLLVAAVRGHLEIVRLLIEAGSEIDIDDMKLINVLEHKDAVWKIINECRKKVSTEIDNALHLDPVDISSIIASYLFPTPREFNKVVDKESDN